MKRKNLTPSKRKASRYCRCCSEREVGSPSPRYGEPQPGLCWVCSDAN